MTSINSNYTYRSFKDTLPAVTSPKSNSGDGYLDDSFKQGSLGDCMLLSTVNSLSHSDNGRKAIENVMSVETDENGNVTEWNFNFDSIGESYSVTVDEVKAAQEFWYASEFEKECSALLGFEAVFSPGHERIYSSGDDDMTAVEIAVEKAFNETNDEYLKKIMNNTGVDKLNGVETSAVTYLFAGVTTDGTNINSVNSGLYSTYLNLMDLECAEGRTFYTMEDFSVYDVDGNEVIFNSKSEYDITENTDEVISFADKETGKEFTLSKEKFRDDVYLPMCGFTRDKVDKALELMETAPQENILIFGSGCDESLNDIHGQEITLAGSHAYAVTDVSGGVVTLENPWDTSIEIKINQDDFTNMKSGTLYFTGIPEEQ